MLLQVTSCKAISISIATDDRNLPTAGEPHGQIVRSVFKPNMGWASQVFQLNMLEVEGFMFARSDAGTSVEGMRVLLFENTDIVWVITESILNVEVHFISPCNVVFGIVKVSFLFFCIHWQGSYES